MVVRELAVAIAVIGRLVSIVIEVDVLHAHRSYTVNPDRQGSSVLAVAPSSECLVWLRTARLVANPARPASTAVAACAIAVGTYQLVAQSAAVVWLRGLSVACSVGVCTLSIGGRTLSLETPQNPIRGCYLWLVSCIGGRITISTTLRSIY